MFTDPQRPAGAVSVTLRPRDLEVFVITKEELLTRNQTTRVCEHCYLAGSILVSFDGGLVAAALFSPEVTDAGAFALRWLAPALAAVAAFLFWYGTVKQRAWDRRVNDIVSRPPQ